MESEVEWANWTWRRACAGKASKRNRKHRRWKQAQSVSFDDSQNSVRIFLKYSTSRKSDLFITIGEVHRSSAECKREHAHFYDDEDYNEWLLDDWACKVERGVYEDRIGRVVLICDSKVHVDLIGVDGIVCINRASIEAGYSGSYEDEAMQRSLGQEMLKQRQTFEEHEDDGIRENDDDDDGKTKDMSMTLMARIRRSARLAGRKS